MEKQKNTISDDAAAALLKPRKPRAKKGTAYHLAKVTHNGVAHYIDGIAPKKVEHAKADKVTYYRAPLRAAAGFGARRGLPIIAKDDDGVTRIQREAKPRGPYTTNRRVRRGYALAIKSLIRRGQKARRRSLAA